MSPQVSMILLSILFQSVEAIEYNDYIYAEGQDFSNEGPGH